MLYWDDGKEHGIIGIIGIIKGLYEASKCP